MPPRDPPPARRPEAKPPFARRESIACDAHAHWRATGELPSLDVPRLGELLLARRRGDIDERTVRDALWLQRVIAAAALASTATLNPLDAQAGGAQLGVGATVPLVAAMQMLYQLPAIQITEDDVRRGFVEVRSASRFSVATTSRIGYAVELVAKQPIFRAVEIVSPLGTARFGPDGGVLVARGRPRRDANAELSYRFELAHDVRVGTYPFPLHLAVRPL